jgi:hypothetical protein
MPIRPGGIHIADIGGESEISLPRGKLPESGRIL